MNDLFDHSLSPLALGVVGGHKDHADAVSTGVRKRKALGRCLLEEKTVRNLQQQPGAISGLGVTPARTAMREVHQNLDTLLDDLVAGASLDVGDESDAASVVFVTRIV